MIQIPADAPGRWQEAAEARLRYLEEVLIDGESDLEPVQGGEEYCGCTTCQVREVITAIVLLEEAADGNSD